MGNAARGAYLYNLNSVENDILRYVIEGLRSYGINRFGVWSNCLVDVNCEGEAVAYNVCNLSAESSKFMVYADGDPLYVVEMGNPEFDPDDVIVGVILFYEVTVEMWRSANARDNVRTK